MKVKSTVIVGLIAIALATGCSSRDVSPTAPSTLSYAEQIVNARQQWDTLEIDDYTISIRFYENFANGITTQRNVSVKDGQVESSTCLGNKCPLFVLTEIFTIDDLFDVAEGATIKTLFASDEDPDGLFEQYSECVNQLSFDSTYGFPKIMSVDCPNSADEEHSFTVLSFEISK